MLRVYNYGWRANNMNEKVKAIMEKNNIKLTDKKVFKQEYINGAVDYYEATFAEWLYAVGINDAILYWNDIDPYRDDITYEKSLELGLIDEDEYEVYLEEMESE